MNRELHDPTSKQWAEVGQACNGIRHGQNLQKSLLVRTMSLQMILAAPLAAI
jgi:hypothetical protein